jgi:hypothetical protein
MCDLPACACVRKYRRTLSWRTHVSTAIGVDGISIPWRDIVVRRIYLHTQRLFFFFPSSFSLSFLPFYNPEKDSKPSS